MQEVPNEVSLAINISGCPYKCPECHSKYLWDYNGEYLSDRFKQLVEMYNDMITCVCFMGGDQNSKELLNYIRFCKQNNIKTCLYTGCDSLDKLDNHLLMNLDYVKIGRYINELGGLDHETTNQKFYDLKNCKQLFFYKREVDNEN